tara:strand:- start:33 stop:752 length:720 start_codon:yes stop_codon:yes gene_type:complete
MVSSCIYIINDIFDIDTDRLHPIKKYRPLPSGKLKKGQLLIAFIIVYPITIIISFIYNYSFATIIVLYSLINIFYSIRLKHIIIVDVIVISMGYVLRVIAGGMIIQIFTFPWIIISTTFLALFIGFAKRRNDIVLYNNYNNRNTSTGYTIPLLDYYLMISASGAIISYAIYTGSEYAFDKFNTYNLIYTTVFVIYGIFRYYYLIIINKLGSNPTDLIFGDTQLIINIFLWVFTIILIIW